ncbi:hypothetical protein LWI29_029030 [Acer saccharum]|uniref:pectinesterase n=1 Tax=Acer saccharum TaxID=4024 RepID=A0AA39VZ74_ACESA|nr:hypothetical protein LWI29_029030 [Acer saccharum]
MSGKMVFCDDTTPIPTDAGGVNGWFSTNVKPAADRKGGLDPTLAAAEESPQVIKIKIEAAKPFITFYGSPDAMPTISYSGTAYQYGTVDSASLIVDSDYFMAANIIIKNSAPKPDGVTKGAQAAALRISGTKAAFYKAKSLYVNTQLHVLGDTGMTITAQARDTTTEDCGYSFVHGQITGVGTRAYLGRAWMATPRVIFSYTTMSSVINPAGWYNNMKPEREKTVTLQNTSVLALEQIHLGVLKTAALRSRSPTLHFPWYIQGSKWVLPPPTL